MKQDYWKEKSKISNHKNVSSNKENNQYFKFDGINLRKERLLKLNSVFFKNCNNAAYNEKSVIASN